jgi:hypothetical protein
MDEAIGCAVCGKPLGPDDCTSLDGELVCEDAPECVERLKDSLKRIRLGLMGRNEATRIETRNA